MHINEKELLAASLAIKAFTKDKHVSHVHLKTDNTTTVSQIQKLGSTRSKSLFNLTTDLWKYCLDNKIMLTAEHLPGTLNTIADMESRMFNDSSNWMLNKEIFKMIMNQFGPAEIDLFADRTNHQLKKYISWKPDPSALKTDAFTVKWNGFLGYAFPPICLIGRCLAKERAEHTNLIIITPTWQGQPWYATLLQMITENPILLPEMNNLLTGPMGEFHPMVQTGAMKLAAWKVSGKMHEIQSFHQQLDLYYRENSPVDQRRLWKRWCCWCSQQSLDPISAPVEAVANYLAEEQIRVGYSALNTTRSAISAYHNKCYGVPIGQHELIKDIMESALKNKPPKPRYTSTWDVNQVL